MRFLFSKKRVTGSQEQNDALNRSTNHRPNSRWLPSVCASYFKKPVAGWKITARRCEQMSLEAIQNTLSELESAVQQAQSAAERALQRAQGAQEFAENADVRADDAVNEVA